MPTDKELRNTLARIAAIKDHGKQHLTTIDLNVLLGAEQATLAALDQSNYLACWITSAERVIHVAHGSGCKCGVCNK